MESKKRVIIVTVTKITSLELKRQLFHFMGDKVEIESYYVEDMPAVLDADLIVLSSGSILQRVQPRVVDPKKILVSRRGIDYNSINLLVNRKAGSRALVVMELYQDASQFCDVLHEMGFVDISFFPWVPGKEIPENIDFAVTTSERHFIPQSIRDVINVGIRPIDFSTTIEILYRLNLLDQKATLLSSRFSNTLVHLYKNLYGVAEETTKTKEYMEAILQLNHDGVIVVDQYGHIILFNKAAEAITGCNERNLIGTSFQDTFPQLKLNGTNDSHNRQEHLIKFGNNSVIVSYSPVSVKQQAIGTVAILKDVSEIHRLETEYRKELKKSGHFAKYSFRDILGNSEKISTAKDIAKKLSSVDSAILITGESGVGKELFAQAIHNASRRNHRPFVAANFSAFADTLIESELFGYEDGAFTGARRGGKPGLFELAHGGTIFLDEIGDASPNIQSRLLRVLQEKQIMRVGDTKMREVVVRIIAATNKNLLEQIKKGLFREDLYYRLASLPIDIPPLRERKEDISFLLEQFIRKANENRRVKFRLDSESESVLLNYPWYGNIRELKNVVDYLHAIVSGDLIRVEDLPSTLKVNKLQKIETKEDVEFILEGFKGKDRGTEYFLILQELNRAYRFGKGMGRRKLAERMAKTDYPITEQEVRSRLAELESFGCVTIQAGAAGTKLTPLGLKMLDKWTSEAILTVKESVVR